MENAIKTNILTIDVEDWFMDAEFSTWPSYENRLSEPINKILQLLKEHNIKATFFVLGYIADTNPDLVVRIHTEGHEIGTHGYKHVPITQMTKESFSEDLHRSITALEQITGKPIAGYRACQFTIMKETAWAIDVLKRAGLQYDSSIFPVKTPLYGVPDAPLVPYPISSENLIIPDFKSEFMEFPLSIYYTPIGTIPVAGGFYLRLFPYSLTRYFLKKINSQGKDIVFYFHPWELDPNQPVVNEFKWYHYYNLNSTHDKLKNLLRDFEFISIREWMNRHGKRCNAVL